MEFTRRPRADRAPAPPAPARPRARLFNHFSAAGMIVFALLVALMAGAMIGVEIGMLRAELGDPGFNSTSVNTLNIDAPPAMRKAMLGLGIIATVVAMAILGVALLLAYLAYNIYMDVQEYRAKRRRRRMAAADKKYDCPPEAP